MRKAANGRARTDAQRQDMPSSTNKLPIHSAWYFRSARLLCSCPHPHEGQLLTSWSWQPGAAGDARKLGLKCTPDSSRLTLQLLRAAKHKQIGREEKKKKNLNLTFTRWHSCDSNSTTCMCMFGNMQQCMTAANSLICLETDSHKMPACNLIAPLN